MNEKLKERFFTFLSEHKISQKKAALEVGYSSRVLSMYKKGTINGKIDKFEGAITEWLEIEERKILSFNIRYVKTAISKKIYDAISLTHTENTMAFISAPEGYGKTITARLYKKVTPGVILVDCDPCMSENALLRVIAGQCGKLKAHRITDLKRKIVGYLRKSNSLIIFDEAYHLTGKAIELIRRIIHDRGRASIVFLDADKLVNVIEPNYSNFKQLGRRVGIFANYSDIRFSLTEARRMAATVMEVPREYVKSIYENSTKSPSIFCTLLKRVLKTVSGDVHRISEAVIKKSREGIWAASMAV